MAMQRVVSAAQIEAKLTRYCADRERCKAEIVQKLFSLKVNPALQPAWIERLEAEGLLNEQRYAHAFVRYKLNSGWGKQKMWAALKANKIPESVIQEAFETEIDLEEYKQLIAEIIRKKILALPKTAGTMELKTLHGIYRLLIQRGYERPLILQIMRQQGLHLDT